MDMDMEIDHFDHVNRSHDGLLDKTTWSRAGETQAPTDQILLGRI